jgi:hypothetical protein
MEKKDIFIFGAFIFFAFVLYISFFLVYSKKPVDFSKISNEEIVAILGKNKDCSDYMKSHSDFKIQDKTILTKESILSGQKGQNFKAVYQGLKLQDNRYMKVDLVNSAGDKGLISVIDFEKTQVLKAYGIILLKVNGQKTSQKQN